MLRRYVPLEEPARQIAPERRELVETPEDVWESDDCVRRTVVLPIEREAAEE